MEWPVQIAQIHFVMTYDVMCCHGVTSLGKNTDKEGMMREGRQRSGVFMNRSFWHNNPWTVY